MFIIFSLTFVFTGKVFSDRGVYGSSKEVDRPVREQAESAILEVPETPKITSENNSVRFRTEMRNLDREYQEGSLTRTEYIQRKRLIMKEE